MGPLSVCVFVPIWEKKASLWKAEISTAAKLFFSPFFFWNKLLISLVLRLRNEGGSFSKTSFSLSSAFKMEFTCN